MAILAAELEAQGLAVDYEPPIEERSAEERVAQWVLIYIVEQSVVDPIVRAAVRDFRKRYPNLHIRINGDESDIE